MPVFANSWRAGAQTHNLGSHAEKNEEKATSPAPNRVDRPQKRLHRPRPYDNIIFAESGGDQGGLPQNFYSLLLNEKAATSFVAALNFTLDIPF